MLKEIANKAALLPNQSVHHWLRDSYGIATDGFRPISFAEAELEAAAQGWNLIDGWENGTSVLRRFMIAETIFRFGDVPADAYLFYLARNRKNGLSPFIPTDIASVELGLIFNFRRPYMDILNQQMAINSTVIEHCLNSDDVRREGIRWPFLRRMRLHYGLRFQLSSDADYHPSGFFVETEFAASIHQPVGYCHVDSFVESKLDPLRGLAGNPIDEDHVPLDEFGETRTGIAAEGWHCASHEEAEALKRTYLSANQTEAQQDVPPNA